MIRTPPASYTSAARLCHIGAAGKSSGLLSSMEATNAIVLGAPIIHVSRPTQLLKQERLDSNYCFQKPSRQAAPLLVP